MTVTQARPQAPISVRATMTNLTHADLPLWLRVGCLAWSRADMTGHARFAPGELRRVLGTTANRASEALDTARSRGWIDPCSTSRCVVLPGGGSNSCDETHRP